MGQGRIACRSQEYLGPSDDAAVAGGGVGPVAEWRARLIGALADRLAAEGERRLLWLPVFFGAGIGVYFLLKVEPPLWPGIAAAIAGVGSVIALRRHRVWCEAALAFTVFAAGFALMRETAWEHEAPMLQRHLGPLAVTGRNSRGGVRQLCAAARSVLCCRHLRPRRLVPGLAYRRAARGLPPASASLRPMRASPAA
jgi:competence protein ComEC